ncbi:MAG: hypothetical protein AAGU75_11945 [Bacillota bacterium]
MIPDARIYSTYQVLKILAAVIGDGICFFGIERVFLVRTVSGESALVVEPTLYSVTDTVYFDITIGIDKGGILG